MLATRQFSPLDSFTTLGAAERMIVAIHLRALLIKISTAGAVAAIGCAATLASRDNVRAALNWAKRHLVNFAHHVEGMGLRFPLTRAIIINRHADDTFDFGERLLNNAGSHLHRTDAARLVEGAIKNTAAYAAFTTLNSAIDLVSLVAINRMLPMPSLSAGFAASALGTVGSIATANRIQGDWRKSIASVVLLSTASAADLAIKLAPSFIKTEWLQVYLLGLPIMEFDKARPAVVSAVEKARSCATLQDLILWQLGLEAFEFTAAFAKLGVAAALRAQFPPPIDVAVEKERPIQTPEALLIDKAQLCGKRLLGVIGGAALIAPLMDSLLPRTANAWPSHPWLWASVGANLMALQHVKRVRSASAVAV